MAYDPDYHREYYQRNKEKKRAQAKAWEERNPEKAKAIRSRIRQRQIASGKAKSATKAWEARNREYILWKSARSRANERGIDFSIAVSDVVIPDVCPILGIVINRDERGRMQASSPSLDRIDNSAGYVPGNVWVISWKANRIKSDASIEDLKVFCANMLILLETRTVQRWLGRQPAQEGASED